MSLKINHNGIKISSFWASLLLFLAVIPVYSNSDIPFYQSSGDSLSANIIYPTIAGNLKKEDSPDIKIKNAILHKSADSTIGIEIILEILKPQFRGSVCTVDVSLIVQSISLDGSSVKIKSALVKSCKSKKGPGMDSLVRAAADLVLKQMHPEIEKNVQKSINDSLLPMTQILRERTAQNINIAHQVHDQGISLYIYTGNLLKNNYFKRLPYTVKDEAECMSRANIEIFQLPSDGGDERIRMFVKNNSGESKSLEAIMSSTVLNKEIYTDRIGSGTEFYWSDDMKKYSGHDFTVQLRLLSHPETEKNKILACGTMSLFVPENGSVMIQITR